MTSTPTPVAPVITEPHQLTPAWLSATLSQPDRPAWVDDVDVAPVGTGQIGSCYRLRLHGTGVPESLVAKLPHPDPATRELLVGTYRAEVRFYTEIALTVQVRVPRCRYGAMTDGSGDFTLLLEDLGDAEQGDQVRGCTVAEARAAAVNLAGLHGPRWCDPTLHQVEGLALNGEDEAHTLGELFGPAVESFVEMVGPRLDAADVGTLEDTAERIAAWSLGRRERFGLVHGDYRLDNLLFAPDVPTGDANPAPRGDADAVPTVTAVDWQTLSLGLPARDLAFLLGTGLAVADRRASERDLVAAYHGRLTELGVTDHPLDECWDDYRFAMLQGPLISVFGCAYGTRTPRGDDMFTAMVQRSCAAIRDLGSLELVG